LSQASTVVAEKIKEGQLKVVAGYYDIGSDTVTLLRRNAQGVVLLAGVSRAVF